MTIKTTTHLNFRGNTRDALTFYRGVFGGDLTVISYADAHAVTDTAEAEAVPNRERLVPASRITRSR